MQLFFFMNKNFKGTTINIGSNIEHKIIGYVKIICKIMNFKGKLLLDLTKPSGTPRKKLSLKKINKFNWKAKTSLEDGLNLTIKSLMDSGLYK